MKTQNTHWNTTRQLAFDSAISTARRFDLATQWLTRTFKAAVASLSVLVISAWIITIPEVLPYLGAALWTGGFAFLALAVESSRKSVWPLVASGLAFPPLGLLASRSAEEWALIAAAILAAWVFAWTWKRS